VKPLENKKHKMLKKIEISEINEAQTPPPGAGGPLIKVCGMLHPVNIQSLVALNPDFIGFIFYKKSKRYAGDTLDVNTLNQIPKTINKVGIFVNETEETILNTINKYNLDYAQLHGDETPEFCNNLKNKGIKIIKAISITENFDFKTINIYNDTIDYFLFDTATPQKGGSGKTFSWQILNNYQGPTPFFLAGGIDENNIETAKSIQNKYLYALDLNSKFEIEPGLKDIEKLKIIL
jgi:phosphoribosylanthranilate isomerase